MRFLGTTTTKMFLDKGDQRNKCQKFEGSLKFLITRSLKFLAFFLNYSNSVISQFDLDIVNDLLYLGKWIVTSKSISVYLGKRQFFENELKVMMQQYLLIIKESGSHKNFDPLKKFNKTIRAFFFPKLAKSFQKFFLIQNI